ncbi:MAG: type II toxin-antitoxin system RelE/ParE family toxin [Elusimicrobiota bacterium]|nr:type II toxin-antitoxin system RelE/ParE family toxin [Elusimicrobiota bacterium]
MKTIMFFYLNGKSPFKTWFQKLDKQISARVIKAIERLENGNFGDCKYLGENLVEMRLHFGAGYRAYFTEKDGKIIILLTAGDKKTQNKDIAKAREYIKLI